MQYLLQLITAFTGSLGFALLFHARKKRILAAALGGLFEWGIYLLCITYLAENFISCLIASASTAVYAEASARCLKAPATVFFIPAIVPLIPGSSLYYTMSCAVQGQWILARQYGFATAQCALSIGAGISLVWAVNYMWNAMFTGKK